jgi:hypothetical protein
MVTLPLFTFILIYTRFVVSPISQCHADVLENSLHYASSFVNIFLKLCSDIPAT